MSQQDTPDMGKNYLAHILANTPRQLDRFGLPMIPPLIETIDEKTRRELQAKQLIRDCFESARRNLPDDALKTAWKDVAKRRRGHPKGSRNPEKDAALVKLYDDLVATNRYELASLPSGIGKFCATNYSDSYGSEPATVEKRLRRLLAKRGPNRFNGLAAYARLNSLTDNNAVSPPDKKSAD